MPEPVSSWADEIEDSDTTNLPAPREEIMGDTKVVTEYAINDKEKKVKIVRTYKIEKKMVPKAIAMRKAWPKFGMSKDDKPGPNPQTTVVAEEILMQFVANKEESEKEQDQSSLDKLKGSNKGFRCRICKEDHWTTQCPYKETLGPLKQSLTTVREDTDDAAGAPGQPAGAAAAGGGGGAGGKYVVPSKRGVEGRVGDSMPDRRRDDTAAIRVSNLSENAQEHDVQELFKPFGAIGRIFIAKDKVTGHCKGFAFVNYYKKEDAEKAISTLNGFGYDHLILSVEWSKPSTDR